ncbi:uncharacterized protein MKZ38_004113 [Zalerion maritima]|uniref:Uncharacterized protein n=1 Tax=Zalerion maritima TaxID=339359 RepID=A0AAD5RLR7_9PEZI|nr:uncharacterized protein MKZ38_004113 [Zalerion maritima]
MSPPSVKTQGNDRPGPTGNEKDITLNLHDVGSDGSNPTEMSHREDVDAPSPRNALHQEQEEEGEVDAAWVRIRSKLRDPFSEFMGVMTLILFGDGVVAQVVLSSGEKGNYQSISWGWGIGVMLGVYVAGKSGGHINPAVTLSFCVFRKFPWRKFPVYMLAQILGAMAGAFIVYGNYKSAIDNFEGAPGVRTVGLDTSSAGIFCTYPASFMTKTGMFFSEFVASSILMMVIFAFTDAGNGMTGNIHLLPLSLFFLIFGIGACFGWETGYAINLARDFGPRLVSYILGYGHEVWSMGDYYFWIPMVAPFFGCVFGGFLYDLLLYTGRDSPINAPYMGLDRLFSWRKWSNTLRRGSQDTMV